jgi:site-specific recombinase XerD
MLDSYFHRPDVVTRLRANPFGECLSEFIAYLHNRGHRPNTVRQYLWPVEHFSLWIASRKLALAQVDEQLIQAFIRHHWFRRQPPAATEPSRDARAGLQHFLLMLRTGGYAPPAKVAPLGPIDRLVADYDEHLREVAGLAAATRILRRRYARGFLRVTFGDRPLRWERLRPKHIQSFVSGFGRSGCFGAGVVAAASLRSFLRWLRYQGLCPASLSLAVPCFRRYKHATLPRVMTDHQLRSFLESFDRSTADGCRDYAMALCQADLGLRVGEVAALTLDDIDWRNGVLRIVPGKTRRGRVLPLPDRTGNAITVYLRHARPTTTCRHLFVRFTLPVGTPVSPELIRGVICRHFAQVEGCERWKGTHALRHTAATRMHRQGASLKAVADILGHCCLDSTMIYTKVDADQLAGVALPWPKEEQP